MPPLMTGIGGTEDQLVLISPSVSRSSNTDTSAPTSSTLASGAQAETAYSNPFPEPPPPPPPNPAAPPPSVTMAAVSKSSAQKPRVLVHVTLRDLIDAGLLQINEELILNFNGAPLIRANVDALGNIRTNDGNSFPTLAKFVTCYWPTQAVGTTQTWRNLSVTRNGQAIPLKALRMAFLEQKISLQQPSARRIASVSGELASVLPDSTVASALARSATLVAAPPPVAPLAPLGVKAGAAPPLPTALKVTAIKSMSKQKPAPHVSTPMLPRGFDPNAMASMPAFSLDGPPPAPPSNRFASGASYPVTPSTQIRSPLSSTREMPEPYMPSPTVTQLPAVGEVAASTTSLSAPASKLSAFVPFDTDTTRKILEVQRKLLENSRRAAGMVAQNLPEPPTEPPRTTPQPLLNPSAPSHKSIAAPVVGPVASGSHQLFSPPAAFTANPTVTALLSPELESTSPSSPAVPKAVPVANTPATALSPPPKAPSPMDPKQAPAQKPLIPPAPKLHRPLIPPAPKPTAQILQKPPAAAPPVTGSSPLKIHIRRASAASPLQAAEQTLSSASATPPSRSPVPAPPPTTSAPLVRAPSPSAFDKPETSSPEERPQRFVDILPGTARSTASVLEKDLLTNLPLVAAKVSLHPAGSQPRPPKEQTSTVDSDYGAADDRFKGQLYVDNLSVEEDRASHDTVIYDTHSSQRPEPQDIEIASAAEESRPHEDDLEDGPEVWAKSALDIEISDSGSDSNPDTVDTVRAFFRRLVRQQRSELEAQPPPTRPARARSLSPAPPSPPPAFLLNDASESAAGEASALAAQDDTLREPSLPILRALTSESQTARAQSSVSEPIPTVSSAAVKEKLVSTSTKSAQIPSPRKQPKKPKPTASKNTEEQSPRKQKLIPRTASENSVSTSSAATPGRKRRPKKKFYVTPPSTEESESDPEERKLRKQKQKEEALRDIEAARKLQQDLYEQAVREGNSPLARSNRPQRKRKTLLNTSATTTPLVLPTTRRHKSKTSDANSSESVVVSGANSSDEEEEEGEASSRQSARADSSSSTSRRRAIKRKALAEDDEADEEEDALPRTGTQRKQTEREPQKVQSKDTSKETAESKAPEKETKDNGRQRTKVAAPAKRKEPPPQEDDEQSFDDNSSSSSSSQPSSSASHSSLSASSKPLKPPPVDTVTLKPVTTRPRDPSKLPSGSTAATANQLNPSTSTLSSSGGASSTSTAHAAPKSESLVARSSGALGSSGGLSSALGKTATTSAARPPATSSGGSSTIRTAPPPPVPAPPRPLQPRSVLPPPTQRTMPPLVSPTPLPAVIPPPSPAVQVSAPATPALRSMPLSNPSPSILKGVKPPATPASSVDSEVPPPPPSVPPPPPPALPPPVAPVQSSKPPAPSALLSKIPLPTVALVNSARDPRLNRSLERPPSPPRKSPPGRSASQQLSAAASCLSPPPRVKSPPQARPPLPSHRHPSSHARSQSPSRHRSLPRITESARFQPGCATKYPQAYIVHTGLGKSDIKDVLAALKNWKPIAEASCIKGERAYVSVPTRELLDDLVGRTVTITPRHGNSFSCVPKLSFFQPGSEQRDRQRDAVFRERDQQRDNDRERDRERERNRDRERERDRDSSQRSGGGNGSRGEKHSSSSRAASPPFRRSVSRSP